DKAVASFEKAISLNPSFEPAYVALAAVYEAKPDRKKAAEVYRKYLQVVNQGSKEIRQHLIQLYITDKAYTEALNELRQMLEQDPDDLDAQLRMGLVYGELKDYPKAIEQLNKILAARPAELKVRDYLGLMYEEMKDYDKAMEAYDRNLKLQPAYVDGHLHKGYLLFRLKRYPEATASLLQAVKLNPKHP